MPIRTAVFRVDASLVMGSGHLMRCLTLAQSMRDEGFECHFISRDHPGSLHDLVRKRGFTVHVLPRDLTFELTFDAQSALRPLYACWLGATQEADALECLTVLNTLAPSVLVVDSYAIDEVWERKVAGLAATLVVIDDLVDRNHYCDYLIDQSAGRDPSEYSGKVPAGCEVFAGAAYAMLRADFARLRAFSLERREDSPVRQVLVSLGGVDADNVTGLALEALAAYPLGDSCEIVVVMGATAPHYGKVVEQSRTLRWKTRVLSQVDDMASLMADSDVAIGAAGSTAWERCCLGLPCLMVQTAENQRFVMSQLAALGAVVPLKLELASKAVVLDIGPALDQLIENRNVISAAAARVVDGHGCRRIMDALEKVQ